MPAKIHDLMKYMWLRGNIAVGNEAASEKRVNRFVSSKRTQLSEMFCFISTPSVGYLYSIGSSFHLVSTYHYETVITQVT